MIAEAVAFVAPAIIAAPGREGPSWLAVKHAVARLLTPYISVTLTLLADSSEAKRVVYGQAFAIRAALDFACTVWHKTEVVASSCANAEQTFSTVAHSFSFKNELVTGDAAAQPGPP